MVLNKDISKLMKEHKIDVNQGVLCLLAYYFDLDPDTTIPEEVVKAVNLTKIIEKDYDNKGELKWNLSLFEGEETNFEWVKDWVDGFGKINIDRKGSWKDAVPRMKAFFAANPEYRKDDVYAARDLYFKTLLATSDKQFCMKSHKFIYDGVGVMKKSTLLEYCEKIKASASTGVGSNPHIKGKIFTE